MKGALFSVVADVVVEQFGEQMWDEVLASAGVDGAYTSLGDYPSTELSRLVSALARRLEISATEVLVLAGRHGFAPLARHHPDVVAGFTGWRDLLASLDGVIHVEVHKLYPGAATPRFAVEACGAGLLVEYSSHRHLCRLAEGLIVGAAQWYGQQVTIEHRSCELDGDHHCVLEVQPA